MRLINRIIPGEYRYPTITPFTIPDGHTYLKTLEILVWRMKQIIDDIDENNVELFDLVVDVLNSKIDEINDAFTDFEGEVDDKLASVDTKISELETFVNSEVSTLVTYVNDSVQQIINSSVEVQDPVVAGMFSDESSQTRQQTDPLYGVSAQERNSNIVNILNHGADPTGAQDIQAAWLSALNTVEPGGTILFPAGTYRVDSVLDNGGKSVCIDATAATFNSDISSFFTLSGAYVETVSVSVIEQVAAIPSSRTGQIRVTLNEPFNAPLQPGDVVKLIADNKIPEARAGSTGNESRVGEVYTVRSADSGVVYLNGVLKDSYTENPRLAKFDGTKIVFNGGTFNRSGFTSTNNITLKTLISPVVNDVTIDDSSSVGVSLEDCHMFEVNRLRVNNLRDNAVDVYAYAVNCKASSYGWVNDSYFSRVRHSYTDDTSRIPVDSLPDQYGRTRNIVLSNAYTDTAYSTAYDTHAASEHITFDNCTAINSGWGFGLRGRNHKVNGVARDCWIAVNVFNEEGAAQSHGHHVNVRVENSVREALTVAEGCSVTVGQLDIVGGITPVAIIDGESLIDRANITNIDGYGSPQTLFNVTGVLELDSLLFNRSLVSNFRPFIVNGSAVVRSAEIYEDCAFIYSGNATDSSFTNINIHGELANVTTSNTVLPIEYRADNSSSRLHETEYLGVTNLSRVYRTSEDITVIYTGGATTATVDDGALGQRLTIINDGTGDITVNGAEIGVGNNQTFVFADAWLTV